MTIPVLKIFAETYPEVKITVVSRKFFEPLFKEVPNSYFVEADVYGKHKGFGIFKLAKFLKNQQVDVVADLHNVIRSKILSKYLKFKGLKIATIDKGRTEKKALTRLKNKKFIQLKTTHQRYADVFSKLGFQIDLSNYNPPKRKVLNSVSDSLIGKEPKKCIGIAPFAAFNSKMYPLHLMKEIIRNLNETNLYYIFLFGGGSKETAILNELEKDFETVTNIAGKLTFEEELAFISNLDCMLSMDSGNAHLAAIYEIPVITVWGVTHPFTGFMPFNQPYKNAIVSDRKQYPLIPTSIYGNKFPEGYEHVMESILPETIVEKIIEAV